MRFLLNIVENRRFEDIEKFWIDSRNGRFEVIEGEDPEHEFSIPDGYLSFNAAISDGWVRGGMKYNDNNMYLEARDKITAQKAVLFALIEYSPDEIRIAWDQEFFVFDLEQAEKFGKTGRLPRR